MAALPLRDREKAANARGNFSEDLFFLIVSYLFHQGSLLYKTVSMQARYGV